MWESVDSHLVGQPQMMWIDSVNNCLKKSGLNAQQARRMVCCRNKWQEFVRGSARGIAQGMNP